jgi:hypothetical protein
MVFYNRLEFWLLLVVALFALGSFLIAYLDWRILKSAEETRTHVDLIPQVVWEPGSSFGDSHLKVVSASPVLATIHGVEIYASRADGKKSKRQRFDGVPITLAPYSHVEMDLGEVLGPICRDLGDKHGSTPIQFRVVVHHAAYGKRAATSSISYAGSVMEEMLTWSMPAEQGAAASLRLSWEETGIIPS